MKSVSTKTKWVGGFEIAGMLLILISFYYQTFYEGDNITQRYDNIRFKLELIQNEIINNSHLIGGQSEYSLGKYWKGFNENKANVNEMSEEHISTIDELNRRISAIRAWIFMLGSILLIFSKYLQYFRHSEYNNAN